MATKVLVVYYSLHGHVEALARAVGAGAESVRNTAVRVRRVLDIADEKSLDRDLDPATLDDLRWADGIAWGTPTRYGTMCTPMKQFLDGMVEIWTRGELEVDAPAYVTVGE
jgi:NAD(P)H dehydrogenase (quinone)